MRVNIEISPQWVDKSHKSRVSYIGDVLNTVWLLKLSFLQHKIAGLKRSVSLMPSSLHPDENTKSGWRKKRMDVMVLVVIPVSLRSLWAWIDGLLVLLRQGQAGPPDPGPDGVCITVPLPGEVDGADHVLLALGDDLPPLLERQVIRGGTGIAGQEKWGI